MSMVTRARADVGGISIGFVGIFALLLFMVIAVIIFNQAGAAFNSSQLSGYATDIVFIMFGTILILILLFVFGGGGRRGY